MLCSDLERVGHVPLSVGGGDHRLCSTPTAKIERPRLSPKPGSGSTGSGDTLGRDVSGGVMAVCHRIGHQRPGQKMATEARQGGQVMCLAFDWVSIRLGEMLMFRFKML